MNAAIKLKVLLLEIFTQFHFEKTELTNYLLQVVSPIENNVLARIGEGYSNDYYEMVRLKNTPIITKSIERHYVEVFSFENQIVCIIRFKTNTFGFSDTGVFYFQIEEKIGFLSFLINRLKTGMVRNLGLLNEYVTLLYLNKEKVYYIIEMYADLMRHRDKFMPFHMMNVSNWALRIGNEMSLTQEELYLLTIASLLHDIGKLHLSESILNKPGRLTKSELEHVRTHSVKSYKLAKVAIFEDPSCIDVPKIIRHHHERFDGNGYPDGIIGEEIPKLARLLAVSDSIDAMMSRRSYKNAMSLEDVVNELIINKGTQFDPHIVDYAIKVIEKSKALNELFSNDSIFIPDVLFSINLDNSYEGAFISGDVFNRGTYFELIPHGEMSNMYVIDDIYDKGFVFCLIDRKLVKYEANVLNFKKSTIQFSLGSIVGEDKVLSMPWAHPCVLYSGNAAHKVDVIEIGTSHLKILIETYDDLCISWETGSSVTIDIEISDAENKFSINEIMEIQRIYCFNNAIVLNLTFSGLTTRDKEKLMMILLSYQ